MLAGMYAFSSAVEVYHRAEQSFGGLLPLWFYRSGGRLPADHGFT